MAIMAITTILTIDILTAQIHPKDSIQNNQPKASPIKFDDTSNIGWSKDFALVKIKSSIDDGRTNGLFLFVR